MKDTTKKLVNYWVLVGSGTALIVAFTLFTQTDAFKTFFVLGSDVLLFVGKWLLILALGAFAVWFIEEVIATGVAKGIRRAEAQRAEDQKRLL